ncbi:hypothetical protein BDV98DRAFT_369301 [Pterulicium gracile]|uniref:Uncharacterized protein n=1 Tax=Pterulicium gracile TaxID=1884261 RepID=A0A5C3Q120_9AGAR|nr:hypothetical protein BDV98DRAFT_369301 [Pterula gracilis]
MNISDELSSMNKLNSLTKQGVAENVTVIRHERKEERSVRMTPSSKQGNEWVRCCKSGRTNESARNDKCQAASRCFVKAGDHCDEG